MFMKFLLTMPPRCFTVTMAIQNISYFSEKQINVVAHYYCWTLGTTTFTLELGRDSSTNLTAGVRRVSLDGKKARGNDEMVVISSLTSVPSPACSRRLR